MDMFYKKLSLYLSENQNISKDDEELYEYAAKIVIHGIINIIVTILIGAFSGMLKECFYFFISFFKYFLNRCCSKNFNIIKDKHHISNFCN